MTSEKPEMPNERLLNGLLFVVFFGFLFPLISPWHVLTLTQLLGFALAIYLEVTLCLAAYENYGLLAAFATAVLTNIMVVVGWTGIRILLTIFLPKSSSPKSPQSNEDQ